MTIYIPTEKYFAYLDINDEFGSEDEKLSILAHSINGMRRLDLVDYLYYGKEDIFQKEKIKYKFPEFPIDEKKLSSHGIAFQPSPGGMELYLWAHGFGQYPHQKFLSEELVFNPIQDIELPDLAILLYENFVKHYLKSQHNKK
jgi:hypothetical protein